MKRRRPWSSFAPALVIFLASCSEAVEESRAEPPIEDGWAFIYNDLGRDAKSPIDLRTLNEPVAGQSGFVKLSADGNSFALGDGSPARFWAVGSDVYKNADPDAIRRHVRFLARIGVNMVRLHAQICPTGETSKLTDVNEHEIDGIWRFVTEAKQQGIYTTISPYWAHQTDSGNWGIPGQTSGGALYGLLFFDETLQRGYKAWAAALYSRPNPYTKIPLATDPAVAIIEVQNEDSLLFWTVNMLKPAHQAALGRKFAAWLVQKYGSPARAQEAWGNAMRPGDDIAAGRVALADIFSKIEPAESPAGLRASDQFAFYVATQRRFYEEIGRFYREKLGCKSLISATNWRSADQKRMDDAERWTYTALDVIAVNRYYNGGVHLGSNASWRIEPGDSFTQKSALLNPREIPTNLRQVVGHPMIVTETSWVNPIAYQAEAPFLASVYQSLTGVDALYWAGLIDAVDFNSTPFFPYEQVKGQQPLMKYSVCIPTVLGGFPAAAILYRKGYVRQADPVVHEERTLQSIRDRQIPALCEDPAFDPNRDKAQPVAANPNEKPTTVDPLAFLTGPVEVKYDGDPSKTRVANLSKLIDRDKKRVRSATGEVMLDYSVGLCTVDAPKAQGACGFLGRAGTIALKDLSIRSANTYATILAVTLDDQPLATSKRVLIQIGTAARPTDWATKDVRVKADDGKVSAGLEVVNTGKPPWRVADSEFGLALKNTNLTKATLIDPSGRPEGDVPVTKARTGITLTPPTDCMYLILE